MIGVIPSGTKTYEIAGDFNSPEPAEGLLYYHPDTKRLYYYSLVETRSSPRSGFFPIWDGKHTYASSFSNNKYFDKDAIISDVETMAAKIDRSIANSVLLNQRRSDCSSTLKPSIRDGDNMFTQCIKGCISALDVTAVDIIDMSTPKIDMRMFDNYYSSLNKISFMRVEKWNVWLNNILHLGYILTIYKKKKRLVTYTYPVDVFDTGIVKYDQIIHSSSDPLKRIVKILMVMENIDKKTLMQSDVDDYTVNNMMTTLNGDKPLSAQLFSRFIQMTNLSYTMKILQRDQVIFEYKE